MKNWRTDKALYHFTEISRSKKEEYNMIMTGEEVSAWCKMKNEAYGYVPGCGGDKSYQCFAVLVDYIEARTEVEAEAEPEQNTTESTEGGEESAPAFTITKNDQFNSVEVSFSGKPSAAVEVREIIDPDGIHKHTISKSGTAYIVTFFEMMGGRWVSLSSPERWSPELVQELVEA